MKIFKTSILKEFKRKGDIFAVLHLGKMVKSKFCIHNGAGLKLDKSSIHEYKIPSF